jgi:hypothetical protein
MVYRPFHERELVTVAAPQNMPIAIARHQTSGYGDVETNCRMQRWCQPPKVQGTDYRSKLLQAVIAVSEDVCVSPHCLPSDVASH